MIRVAPTQFPIAEISVILRGDKIGFIKHFRGTEMIDEHWVFFLNEGVSDEIYNKLSPVAFCKFGALAKLQKLIADITDNLTSE